MSRHFHRKKLRPSVQPARWRSGRWLLVILCAFLGVFATASNEEARGSGLGSPPNKITIYPKANFKGVPLEIIIDARKHKKGVPQNLPSEMRDKMKSLKWSLSSGVVVVFYDHADGRGKRYTIWSRGEKRTLDRNELDNDAESWAWFRAD